jgi:two-component system response regulator FixJ
MADLLRVALVDDDEAVLDALRLYLERSQVRTACFRGAADLLALRDLAQRFDCIVADVRMPGMSGLALVDRLAAAGTAPPVILITGHGDVDMAVAAIKRGAFDFIEKPFDEARLLEAIREAAGRGQQGRSARAALADVQARWASLSERQRQVMDLASTGLSNKEIATQLNISRRTVEIHRAWMMERMGARNVAELVRMAMLLRTAGS